MHIRRRNSDDALRKAERQAASGEPSDIAAYWKLCIRARVKPAFNLSYTEDLYGGSAPEYHVTYKVWTLYPKRFRRYSTLHKDQMLPCVYIQDRPNMSRLPGEPDVWPSYPILVKLLQHYEDGPKHNMQTLCLTDKDYFEALQYLVDLHESGWVPLKRKRRNGDDAVRKAERAWRASPNNETLVAYWKACLRAGILPEPVEIGSREKYWYFGQYSLARAALREGPDVRAWRPYETQSQAMSREEALEVVREGIAMLVEAYDAGTLYET